VASSQPSTLTQRTATELLGLLNAGEVSSEELTQAYAARIAAVEPKVGAFLRVDVEAALAQARAVDAKRKKGEKLGKLAGLPVAVKDLLCANGDLATCGSRMLENYRAPYDSTVVAKLKAADAVLLGRTNMDEFAMGGSTENSALGKTQNPWDLTRTPGGSSGGAAACVAADMACLSIGTDTGGSIRQPASHCGIVGLKPTYGRVSRFGLVAFASSLDQAGPMTRTAEDAALLLETIAGHDPLDATSINEPVPNYTQSVREPLKGLTLGLVREHFAAGLDGDVERAVREAIKVYESLGAKVKEISFPHAKYGVAVYYIIAPCEASSNLARYDGIHYGRRTDEALIGPELEAEKKALLAEGKKREAERMDTALVRLYRKSRAEGFGAEVKRRIMLGTYALSHGYYDAFYVKALKVRRLIRQDYDEAFKQVDLIVGPVSTSPAFKIGEKVADPMAMYLVDLYTVSANLAGVGGISIPCGLSSSGGTGPEGLPIGLQLQAPPLGEDKLLRAAHMFQTATDWHTRRPQI
jgi:aspartyl-tRNA(Asn)/glutamyl-tRNA(Gln) amidotransferase subunit A